MAYTVVLTILMSVSGYLLLTRSEVELTVLREPEPLPGLWTDQLANPYSIQLVQQIPPRYTGGVENQPGRR
jgi:hypothetical protein